MPKILYINQYFKHPGEPGSTRSYWIAKHLMTAGYDVTIVAHKNTAHTHVKEAKRKERVVIDGIEVVYLRNYYANSMGVISRAWTYASFMIKATWVALIERNVDLVIATSTPLTIATPARVRKYFRKTPYVFEVRDLWPEVPIQMGAIRNTWLVRFLQWFEKTTYQKAEHVIALSPGMQDGVLKYIPVERTSMIPNMAKIDQFWPREKNNDLIEKMGLKPDSFKVLYFGQMGLSNSIPYIVDAAVLLEKTKENIEVVFVGHGRMMHEVKKRVADENLKNIYCFDRVPMKEMSEIVNFCNVALVTFSNLPILYTNSPNKLFDALSGGKPVIVNSPGWTKDMVEADKCGLFADPSHPNDLAEKIRELKFDPERCAAMGNNARRLAETVYDKSILCEQFVRVIDKTFSEISSKKNT